MSWKDTITEQKPSWRDTIVEEVADKTSPLVSGIRKGVQGATAGFSDELAGFTEGAGRAVGLKGLGGPMRDISLESEGPTLDLEQIKQAYATGRDRERGALRQDSIDNPGVSVASELAAGILSPINKLLPGGLVKQGAVFGGVNALGMSEAEDALGLAKDTGMGAAFGALVGKGVDKASPYLQKGAQKVGQGLKSGAESIAYASTGAKLKDFRVANDRDQLNEIGRWLLDNKIIKAGGTLDDVARKAGEKNLQAGTNLDDVYSEAKSKFGSGQNQIGFDPKRDKQSILSAAREELGDAVGAESAINRLSSYLDEVAARHGDEPLNQAMGKYQKEVAEYLPEFKKFIKERSAYRNAYGKAADDLDQPILDGMYDDLQRTESRTNRIELQGKDASVAYEEPLDYYTQQDLFAMPQRPPAGFNPARGDDLLPMQQEMALNENTKQKLLSEGYQSSILGLQSTPRSSTVQNLPGVSQGQGQTNIVFAPTAPARPARPGDIRNPMSPRGANDIKTELDKTINYARNPQTRDPVAERAFSAARQKMSQVVDDSIESLGGPEMVSRLKKANKDYGFSRQVLNTSEDQLSRESANKYFGLTDTIAGGAALGYGGVTNDWQGAGALLLTKKGLEKYGLQAGAVVLDKISKSLLKSPQLATLAQKNPAAFQAMVFRLGDSMIDSEAALIKALPRAAENQTQDGAQAPPPRMPINQPPKAPSATERAKAINDERKLQRQALGL